MLNNNQGRVSIEPALYGKIKVQTAKFLRGDSEEELKELAKEVTIDFEENNSELIIITDCPKPRPSKIKSMWVDFKIFLPREMKVVVKTSNGGIEITGMRKKLTLTTSNGRVNVSDHIGELYVRSSNGSISIEKVEGNLNLRTSNGRIAIEDTKGEIVATTSNASINVDRDSLFNKADLHTSNGGIEYRGKMEQDGHYEMITSNNSIKVWIDQNLGYDLYATTSNGNVKISFPMVFDGSNESKFMKGTLFGGGTDLTLRTSNSNIYLNEWSGE